MGEEDVKRQALNVFSRMELWDKVEAVTDGLRVLKDAVNAALRSWVAEWWYPLYPWFCLGALILPCTSISKVLLVENNKAVTWQGKICQTP